MGVSSFNNRGIEKCIPLPPILISDEYIIIYYVHQSMVENKMIIEYMSVEL